MGCSKSSPKREVYSNTMLPQETRKALNKNLILHLKQLEKKQNKIKKNPKRKHKDQSRNKWKRNERNNSKD